MTPAMRSARLRGVSCHNVFLQRVNPKELPNFTGYLRKGLRTVSANLSGDELRGFTLKVRVECTLYPAL